MNSSLSISINHRYNNYKSKFKVPTPANGNIQYISSLLDTQNKNTCRTKAEEDRESSTDHYSLINISDADLQHTVILDTNKETFCLECHRTYREWFCIKALAQLGRYVYLANSHVCLIYACKFMDLSLNMYCISNVMTVMIYSIKRK
jgi:hypothetical protein